MSDLNLVALVGNLTRDAELKYSNNSFPIVKLTIAVNRTVKSADGSYENKANFFDCVYMGKPAENVHKYLLKGKKIAISGELIQNTWKGSDGQQKTKIEINVKTLELLSSSEASDTPKSSQKVNTAAISSTEFTGGPEDFEEDDIPF